jgi:DNA polymerase-3 subunit gamma/tau
MADVENLPLHRKYRPKTMIEYVGNTKVKDTVNSVLKSDKRPQVIMLYGESGCGKTSIARLLAKEYSCTNRNSVSGACGECESCKVIEKYIQTGDTSNLTNVHEIDITEQSGKSDLADTIEEMMIPTFEDEWKIYILDEIQESSHALQNRLLKIAEEPPERVLLLMCTTRPDKIIDTLKNRCQLQLKINKPKLNELKGLLKWVCEKEGIEYDNKGIEFLATRSDLVIRTSLQYLQQVIDEQNSAKYEFVTKVFEEVSDKIIIKLMQCLKKKDTFGYISTLNEIKCRMDLSLFLTQLKDFVRKGIYTINGVTQEGISDNELIIYRELFGDMGVEKIAYLLNKLLTIDSKNLELELIMLGYTGLNVRHEEQQEIIVKPLENEIAEEEKGAKKSIEIKEEIKMEQALENTERAMKTASIEAILAMGGTLVN